MTYICSFSNNKACKRFAPPKSVSTAENRTGVVFNRRDKVDVNYEGIDDQHGWRIGEICAVDKAVFIFYISSNILFYLK